MFVVVCVCVCDCLQLLPALHASAINLRRVCGVQFVLHVFVPNGRTHTYIRNYAGLGSSQQ
jgi:hypothetical protein